MDDRSPTPPKLNADKKLFYEWSDSFLRRQSVHELATKIRTITTFSSSGELLLECLIRACYDARQWDDSHLHGDSERSQWRNQVASIKTLDEQAQNFLDVLSSEDQIANEAMMYSNLDKSLASSKLRDIKILIQDFQAALNAMKNPDKIDNLNVCRDYQYGPFLLLDRYPLLFPDGLQTIIKRPQLKLRRRHFTFCAFSIRDITHDGNQITILAFTVIYG